MSSNLNKVFLIGNLTRDAVNRVTESGQPVTDFTLGTSRHYTTAAGEKKSESQYHDIVCWGWLADWAKKYKKGDKVSIEGRLQTRSYETVTGEKKYKTEVIAENLIDCGT